MAPVVGQPPDDGPRRHDGRTKLPVAHGVRPAHANDTCRDILDAPDREAWLDWLRQRPLALQREGWLCVHAGVAPAWDAARTLVLAAEVEQMLRGPDLGGFLPLMYGNKPALWSEDLQGADRWRHVINVLTRIRFVHADGTLDFKCKEGPERAPPDLTPWYALPGRAITGTRVAFGHWSALGLVNRPDLLCLDTGCAWGGALTAVRVDGGRRDVLQVPCASITSPAE